MRTGSNNAWIAIVISFKKAPVAQVVGVPGGTGREVVWEEPPPCKWGRASSSECHLADHAIGVGKGQI